MIQNRIFVEPFFMVVVGVTLIISKTSLHAQNYAKNTPSQMF